MRIDGTTMIEILFKTNNIYDWIFVSNLKDETEKATTFLFDINIKDFLD